MQNRRSFLFLALALVLGLAAALAARDWAREQIPVIAQSSYETTDLVVARADLAVGTALDPSQLETVEWPKGYLPAGAQFQTAGLEGRVLRRSLTAGEPIVEPALLPEGAEAGLISRIDDNRRAVSVKVDPVIGVAGFVTPGARVDVLATLRRKDRGVASARSKVILQDVPVLAVDQKVDKSENGKPELVSVVTLEVDPAQAERLIFSAHEGRLQLALRNPGDRVVVETDSASVTEVLGGAAKKPRPARRGVQVIRGSKVSNR